MLNHSRLQTFNKIFHPVAHSEDRMMCLKDKKMKSFLSTTEFAKIFTFEPKLIDFNFYKCFLSMSKMKSTGYDMLFLLAQDKLKKSRFWLHIYSI